VTVVAHYFTERPGAPSQRREVDARLRGRSWTFLTDRGVFARQGIDPGTQLLIEAMRIEAGDDVLDLGCGYGSIGLVAATLALRGRVVMVDVNERAVALARENAMRAGLHNVEVYQGDGTAPVRGRLFHVVAMNPPIRAGRDTVRRLFRESRDALRPGGRFYLVVRTAQGAKTLAKEMETLFPQVREVARGGGYRVYEGVKGAAGV
jgi:16S rRNA (guanine1207-N2)-methyltransferase